MKLAAFILKVMQSGIVFSDMQVKPHQKLAYRTPLKHVFSDFIPTQQDITEFMDLASVKIDDIVKGGGQYNTSFNVESKVKLRCNFFFEGNENMVSISLRRIPLKIATNAELGIPSKLKELISSNMQGLILVTGPTGAGKTTTKFSIAEELNNSWNAHIITLESPVEYEMHSAQCIITQREIPKNVKTFAEGIEAARRQRPELIIIGEVMNKDTVTSLCSAASTGHLVLAGTHANSAEDGIASLLSEFSGPELEQRRSDLSKTLLAVIYQRLLPSVDGSKAILSYDLLVPNDNVRANIRDGDISSIRNNLLSGNRNGSELYEEVLAKLVISGKISEQTAELAAHNKNLFHSEFDRLLSKR